MQEPSALSLLPPVLVVVLAVFLRRPILSLLIGALFGLAMLGPTAVLANFAEISLKVMQDETIAWLILVCGGFGALIALLVRTGGASADWQEGCRGLEAGKGRAGASPELPQLVQGLACIGVGPILCSVLQHEGWGAGLA